MPTTNPEHAAVRSYASAPVAPISACTVHADPKASSGELVARMIKSTSFASTFAIANAFFAAPDARLVRLSSPEMTCLLPIPVRVRIHSSLVSTSDARSSFVSDCAGSSIPTPAIFAPAGVNAEGTTEPPRALLAPAGVARLRRPGLPRREGTRAEDAARAHDATVDATAAIAPHRGSTRSTVRAKRADTACSRERPCPLERERRGSRRR